MCRFDARSACCIRVAGRKQKFVLDTFPFTAPSVCRVEIFIHRFIDCADRMAVIQHGGCRIRIKRHLPAKNGRQIDVKTLRIRNLTECNPHAAFQERKQCHRRRAFASIGERPKRIGCSQLNVICRCFIGREPVRAVRDREFTGIARQSGGCESERGSFFIFQHIRGCICLACRGAKVCDCR